LIEELKEARDLLREVTATTATLSSAGFSAGSENVRRSAFDWASLPHLQLSELSRVWPQISKFSNSLLSRLDADAKYHLYIERQKRDIEKRKADERLEIPADLNLDGISGLSNELKARFRGNRPTTIAHASRLEGVTPAALLLLAAHSRRHPKPKVSK
jgi:tRNA uridine 5-carboxymethylaminomethyl modification enzyme